MITVKTQLDSAELDSRVAAMREQVISWRRHLHMHPELSFHEQLSRPTATSVVARARVATRTGVRNGYRTWQLTTRIGSIELRMPRDRAGEFQPSLFARYQRVSKRSSWPSPKCTCKACRPAK